MLVPVCDRPLMAELTEAQDCSFMETKALQFTEKCRCRHASSPLLDLPIRQLL